MGAKRKKSEDGKSPKKQHLSPEEESIQIVESAISGPLGAELATSEKTMLLGIVKPALSQAKEERHALEAKLARLIGDGLMTAGTAKGQKAAATTATYNEVRQVEAEKKDAADFAAEKKAATDNAVEKAEAAVTAAEAAEEEAEKAHGDRRADEAGLSKESDKLEAKGATYSAMLQVVQASSATVAETKKLVGTLKSCGAPGALVDGIPKAIGSSDPMSGIFLSEAAKILNCQLAEAQGALGNWPAHVASVQAAVQLAAQAVQATQDDTSARGAELSSAKDNLKVAKQELKAAEAALKVATKAGEKAGEANSAALGELQKAEEAGKAFDFLYSRSSAAAEDAIVVE